MSPVSECSDTVALRSALDVLGDALARVEGTTGEIITAVEVFGEGLDARSALHSTVLLLRGETSAPAKH